MLRTALITSTLLAAGGCSTAAEDGRRTDAPELAPETSGVVDRVTDGDTIRLRGGARVRLVQVDAPEVDDREECGGEEAAGALRGQLQRGTRVRLTFDPATDRRDDFGRLLAYVSVEDEQGRERIVNRRIVSLGHAAPYFYRGTRGRMAEALERDAATARAAGRGFWGACPEARYAPTRGVDTGPVR